MEYKSKLEAHKNILDAIPEGESILWKGKPSFWGFSWHWYRRLKETTTDNHATHTQMSMFETTLQVLEPEQARKVIDGLPWLEAQFMPPESQPALAGPWLRQKSA